MWSEIGKHRVVTDFIGHVIKKMNISMLYDFQNEYVYLFCIY